MQNGLWGYGKIRAEYLVFFGKYNITTKHKSDHQFESVVIRIIGIEQFHSIGAVDHGFGHWNARGTVGHRWMIILQGAP